MHFHINAQEKNPQKDLEMIYDPCPKPLQNFFTKLQRWARNTFFRPQKAGNFAKLVTPVGGGE
jgi:hypothetical protein